jgi:hypothetical protein
MPLKVYEPPSCECRQLPHSPGCPVAPFFDESDKLILDSAQGDYHDEGPFVLECPRGCRFLQFEHAVGYDYEPVSGQTENTEIPLVCPKCGWSDKQTLPALVGFDPNDDVEDEAFKIHCPNTQCGSTWHREDGVMSLWLEQIVLTGVNEARVRGITYYKGQIIDRFTELSVECWDCGHQCGETED